MKTNKKEILAKAIKTKPGSLVFACVVGTGLITISAATSVWAFYHKVTER